MFVRVPLTSLGTALKLRSRQIKHVIAWQRCLSSQDQPRDGSCRERGVTPFPPLSQPIKELPKAIYSTSKEDDEVTQVTTLSNGLKVASENRFGQVGTVGALINSGPRFEVAYPSGISHFLEKLAYNSTKNYSNKDEIMLKVEENCGLCDCMGAKDTFAYAASVRSKGLDSIMHVLGDSILRPRITDNELDMARQAIEFEIESLLSRPEQERILSDMIHAAAYRGNTLGLPKICPRENIQAIDRKTLFTYLKNHYKPERMVVAGVGVNHDDLVRATEKYFVNEKAIWDEDSSIVTDNKFVHQVDDSIAQYTGGYILDECHVPVYAGDSGLPELSHVVIGLESCSFDDPDFIATCVLGTMMGGGGSFSAGGPGKGMFTRLYVNVLHRYNWMYSATANNNTYTDTGLFTIHASTTPPHFKEMVEVIVHEMVAMTGNISDSELSRAKKYLQLSVMANLEFRSVIFEDMARQVLVYGLRKRPDYFMQEIEKITKEDVHRVAQRLLKSPPSVAARGDLRNVPSYADIQAGLLDSQGRMPGVQKRLSLFR